MDHPSEEILKRFAAGQAGRGESKAVVAHLLKGCGECAAKVRVFMQPEPVQRNAYEPSLERFDRDLIEGLESSVSPDRTLRSLLTWLRPPLDPKRRDEE